MNGIKEDIGMKKIYAIFMMAAAFAACSKEEELQVIEEPETLTPPYMMTIEATKGVESTTRALTLDGKTLNATWNDGEIVEVYQSGAKIGELTAEASADASTTLTGSFESAPSTSADLTFYFHTNATPGYSGQDGTLETIASTYDFCAPATVTVGNFNVDDVNKKVSVPGGISFGANKQAIIKFTIRNKANSETISPFMLTVSDGTSTVILNDIPADTYTNLQNGDGVLYVAFPAEEPATAKTITLTATDGDKYYLYQKAGVTFSNSQYYAIGVKMEESDLARPLTFEAKTAGATVTFTKGSSFTGTVQYSTDGGKTWANYASAITLTNVGDKVLFRGNNSTYYSGSASKFSCGGDCYLYGNIMSLVSSMNYLTTTSAGGSAFRELFAGNTHIKSHATKKLILSATTLTGGNSCNKMFNGCTGLTTLPELHVTTLGNYCYQNMFNGCTGLTSVPEDYLPATTLTSACYLSMFEGCTNLTSVPNLPATTLQPRCYYNMFKGCTKLTTVPSNLLPATTMANAQESKGCYEGMFQNCTKLENLPNLPATVLKDRCYTNMFYGCTSLTTIPSNYLPAATLAPYCYTNMFRGAGMTTVNTNMMSAATTMAAHCCESMFRECPNLTNTPEIFATTLDEYCCNAMFYHCTKITTSAPLHATTLVDHCYYNLFNGCSLLASVTCYATDISAENCTNIWLADAGKDVTGTKTIYTPSTTAWPNNTSGIPSGWTRAAL